MRLEGRTSQSVHAGLRQAALCSKWQEHKGPGRWPQKGKCERTLQPFYLRVVNTYSQLLMLALQASQCHHLHF